MIPRPPRLTGRDAMIDNRSRPTKIKSRVRHHIAVAKGQVRTIDGNDYKRGDKNMSFKIISGVAALALAFSTAAALAQTQQGPVGQYDQGSASAAKSPVGQYDQGGASASKGPIGQYDQGGASAAKSPIGQYDQGGASASKGPVGQYDQGGASASKGPVGQYDQGGASAQKKPGQ